MYWDAGMFGGVIEMTEGLRYDTNRPERQFIPYGSDQLVLVDILMHDLMLPRYQGRGFYLYSEWYNCLRQQL